MATETRPIYEIANEIIADYAAKGKPVYYAAAPYVQAMRELTELGDMYGADTADSVLRYALSNLSYWRGDTAKRVKAEIREMLDLK